MFIQLKQAYFGKPVGERVDVDEAHAHQLIASGVAEAIPGDPIGSAIQKSLEGVLGQLTTTMGATIDAALKEFANAQSKSRKNAVPAIFGEGHKGDTKHNFGDWLIAVRTGNQKRLTEEYQTQVTEYEGKTALTTQAGAQGGYLVPVEFLPSLMAISAEQAIVEKRATVLPMAGNTLQVPALDVTTAPTAGETSMFGGLQANWTEEAATLDEEEPAFKQITLTAHELSGFTYASNSMLADSAVGLAALLNQLFGGAIGWYKDYAFLRGNGAGKPLGVVSWTGFISVARSAASAFALADMAGVLARWLPDFNPRTSCWACHPTVLAKLFQLADIEGHVIFLDNARDKPRMMLAGLPLEVTEKLPSLNTAGDIILCDFKHYLIGDRQQVEIAYSEHFRFTNNQSAWRFVARCDGQPWLRDKITLSDASSTISPFVGLAAG